jgi:hypothetical protein
MAGFGHLFSNLTDQVFQHQHQPRIANVWNRASSRTAHLFDKANVNNKSHGVAKTDKPVEASEVVEKSTATEQPAAAAALPVDVAIISESVPVETAVVEGEDETGSSPDEIIETLVDLVM